MQWFVSLIFAVAILASVPGAQPAPPPVPAPAAPAPASAPDRASAAGTASDRASEAMPAPGPVRRPALLEPVPPGLKLDLDQAIRQLLRANAEIGKAKEAWLAERDKFRGSFGIYEPALVGNWEAQRSDRPTTLLPQVQRTYSGGLEGVLPSATKYNLGFTFTDLDNRFVETVDRPNAFTGITVTQPILQGLWFGKPVAEVQATRAGAQAAFHRYRSAVCAAIAETLDKYWRLRYAQDKLEFAASSVEMAEELVADSKLRLRVGMGSEIDTVESSAGLASRLAGYYTARMELDAARNDLRLLLWGRDDSLGAPIEAISPLREPERRVLDSLRAHAESDTMLERQPDYQEKRSATRKQRVAYDSQRDECLPELNLKGTWGYRVTGPTSSLAWQRFTDEEFLFKSKTYSAGVELRVPLFLKMKERGLRSAEKHNLMQAEIDEANTRNQLKDYLAMSLKRLEILQGNAENAAIVVDYRRNLLDAELKKQRMGKSDYHKIFEIEEDLTKARLSEKENTLEYLSTLGQLQRISGTMLMDFGLESYRDGQPVLEAILERPGGG